MSAMQTKLVEFRAAYRKLIEEAVRLTRGDSALRYLLLKSLFASPLRFPDKFSRLPEFARVRTDFRLLVDGWAGSEDRVRELARGEVNSVRRLSENLPPPQLGSSKKVHVGNKKRSAQTIQRAEPAAQRGAPGLLGADFGGAGPDAPVDVEFEQTTVTEPSRRAAAAAPTPQIAAGSPAPPQSRSSSEVRFLNAAIANHDPRQSLAAGESYLLEFGVGLQAQGDGSTRIPDANVLFAPEEDLIELTVSLTSEDFDIVQGPTPLKLPRTGPSKGKARFDITPRSNGRGALTATVHKQGNFLLQMVLMYSVGSAVAAEPATATAHGRPFAAAAQLQPRELGISMRPGVAGTFDCTVWGAVSNHVSLPVTELELTDIVGEARRALMSVVTQRDVTGRLVFQTGIAVDADDQAKALKTLARAGARLFQRIFFGPSAGKDVNELGSYLARRATSAKDHLKLQIVAHRFPIPWGLLYFGEVASDETLDWDLFLGMRHIIEQIPLQTNLSVDDPEIVSDPEIAVSVNVNAGIDKQMKSDFVSRQLAFWKQCETKLGAQLRLELRRSRAEVLLALRGRSPDQIMYLYCHAVTSNPNDAGGISGSHLVLTGDERLTLNDLNLEAPMSTKLSGKPLIFINACESAELTPAFYDGFVPYFMAKGARGVIGTECQTPALFATEWALRFFPRFLAGEPLGELFLALRQQFSKQHNNPLGLLYAVYCDGDTQVHPGLTV